jgi:ceramide kinase
MSSTTGARDPVTSALHIILGDSMPLDIVRMTGWNKCPEDELDEKPKVQYAASFTGYGFYGDVTKESESLRWMGPARYDAAGFKVFMKHK